MTTRHNPPTRSRGLQSAPLFPARKRPLVRDPPVRDPLVRDSHLRLCEIPISHLSPQDSRLRGYGKGSRQSGRDKGFSHQRSRAGGRPAALRSENKPVLRRTTAPHRHLRGLQPAERDTTRQAVRRRPAGPSARRQARTARRRSRNHAPRRRRMSATRIPRQE